jgi:hypothetical protein
LEREKPRRPKGVTGAVQLTHSARAGPRRLLMVGYFTANVTVTTACVSIGWLASVAGR